MFINGFEERRDVHRLGQVGIESHTQGLIDVFGHGIGRHGAGHGVNTSADFESGIAVTEALVVDYPALRIGDEGPVAGNGFGGADPTQPKARLIVHFPDVDFSVIVQWIGGVFITEYFLGLADVLADKRVEVFIVQLGPNRGRIVLGLEPCASGQKYNQPDNNNPFHRYAPI